MDYHVQFTLSKVEGLLVMVIKFLFNNACTA